MTVADREDIDKGVEYTRLKVMVDKSKKRCDRKIFEESLDCVTSKKIWIKKKLIEIFKYNDGEN